MHWKRHKTEQVCGTPWTSSDPLNESRRFFASGSAAVAGRSPGQTPALLKHPTGLQLPLAFYDGWHWPASFTECLLGALTLPRPLQKPPEKIWMESNFGIGSLGSLCLAVSKSFLFLSVTFMDACLVWLSAKVF